MRCDLIPEIAISVTKPDAHTRSGAHVLAMTSYKALSSVKKETLQKHTTTESGPNRQRPRNGRTMSRGRNDDTYSGLP